MKQSLVHNNYDDSLCYRRKCSIRPLQVLINPVFTVEIIVHV